MLSSLRVRFFIVVWTLLVAGLVGLGLLLGRWSTIEISRVSAEARVDRMMGESHRNLISAVLTAPTSDSAAVSAALAREVARDTMLRSAAVLDQRGRIVASAIPAGDAGALRGGPRGRYEYSRTDTADGHTSMIRMLGNGELIDPRDSGDPRWLVVVPAMTHTQVKVGTWNDGAVLAMRVRWALLVGAILAAIVTLAISGPLIGRVGALSKATARLREGDLGARVDVRGSDELANLGRSFNAMAEDLERSEGQRKQMIVDIAHELRTPLTNLTGLIESVQDGLRSPDAATLAALHEETGLLERLVDDLRDLTLADAGELRVATAPIDVAQVAARAAASFDARHGIVVELPAEPAIAMADERRLGQVLRNLIQNAVTHSGEPASVRVAVRLSPRAQRGGETVRESSAPSVATLPRGDSTIEVTISDRGPGIPADVLPRIWDRFYRADASRTRATGGMGLGLPVARRLVEAMGGEITVESVVGEGSAFTVSLSPRP